MLKDKYIYKKITIHKNCLINKNSSNNKPTIAVGTTTRMIFRNNMKEAKKKKV